MRKMLWLGVLGCFLLLTAQCTKVIEERIYTQLPANVILSGDGAPALNLGKVGDYYLDVTNTNLYGAKTAEGWGTPISLKGLPGNDGAPGAAGSNGTTPHIGDNGNWFIGKKDTGIKAAGTNGSDGTTPHIGGNGNWFIGTRDTGIKAAGTNGTNGVTPHIGGNGNWFIGKKDTGIKAAGTNGSDGTTPHIGGNGNWFIGTRDTGIKAAGTNGTNGVTPHIGGNGNWFIGKKDTGIKAAGTNGSDGTTPHIGDNGNWFIGNKDTKIKAAGANGKDGLPGKDGSVIYAEAGKPTADKGKQGDYYIDTETKMFYGPKGATNWDLSTGFSLTAQQLSSENYELSSDGKTLLKWKNEKTRFIDMNADPKLRAVEKIGDNAFAPIGSPAKELTTILIGDNVTEIGRAAFNSCYRLKTIDIPEGLTKIGEEAFANCVRLQQIDLPETITSVEKLTFTGCIRLNNIVIPSGVTAIKDRAFLGCTSLSNVFILQETAFVISTTAFDSAKALQNIYVPTNIQNANDKDKFVNQYKALNPTYAAKIR